MRYLILLVWINIESLGKNSQIILYFFFEGVPKVMFINILSFEECNMYLVTAALRISHGPWMLSREICAKISMKLFWNSFISSFLYILLIFRRISYIYVFYPFIQVKSSLPLDMCASHFEPAAEHRNVWETNLLRVRTNRPNLTSTMPGHVAAKICKRSIGEKYRAGKLNRQFLWNYKYILRGSSFFIRRNAVLS